MTQLGPIDKNSIYPLDVFRKMTDSRKRQFVGLKSRAFKSTNSATANMWMVLSFKPT